MRMCRYADMRVCGLLSELGCVGPDSYREMDDEDVYYDIITPTIQLNKSLIADKEK
jgi:hypothetical protein